MNLDHPKANSNIAQFIENHSKVMIGIMTYLGLLILAIVYYEQRIGILDAAFQLFSILEGDSLAIQANRFGAAVTQIFPLLGSKMGFSLSVVAMLYSSSFIIYYFASFLLAWFGFKNQKIAVVILLFNTLITTHSFFWIQCELVQGVVFTLLYIAALEQQIKKGTISTLFYVGSFFSLVIIAFFYPLLPIVLFFSFGFLYLHYKRMERPLLTISGSFLVIYIIKLIFFRNPYDSNAMSALNNFIRLFPDYFTIPSHGVFLRWLIHDYYLLAIFSIWIIGYYFHKKEQYKLGLFLLFEIGFLMLIQVSYYSGADQFYLEPQYSILSIFIAFPLVYDILPKLKFKSSNLILIVVMLLCFIRIFKTENEYTQRLNWYKTAMETTTEQKKIMKNEDIPMDIVKMTWGISYEFWIISTIEKQETRSVIVEEKPNELDWTKNKSKKMIMKWGVFDYGELNSRYFIFRDTVGGYKK